MKRHLLLGALLALPIALLALSSATPFRAVAAAAPAVLALIVLDRALSARFDGDSAFWITVLAAYGTAVFPLLAHEPDLRRSLALLAGALTVALAPRSGPWSQARAGAALVLALAGLACGGAFDGGPSVPRRRARAVRLAARPAVLDAAALGRLRRPRDGSPAAAAPGLAARGDRPAAAPVRAVPSRRRPRGPLGRGAARGRSRHRDRVGDALRSPAGAPVLAGGQRGRARRRPEPAVHGAVPRRSPRDDTVRFADVAEGNARRLRGRGGLARGLARQLDLERVDGLPAARWDLLSGERLDPRRGVRIDVGDLEQDAAFLLDGWSVRHACGDGVCREVEGRAEMVVPLERPPTRLDRARRGTGQPARDAGRPRPARAGARFGESTAPRTRRAARRVLRARSRASPSRRRRTVARRWTAVVLRGERAVNVEEYERMYEAEERQWWYAGMRAISLALLRPSAPRGARAARILDAGCGTGQQPRAISRRSGAAGGRRPLRGRAALLPARAACRPRAASVLALPFADARVRLRDLLRRALPPLGRGRPRRRCASWRACCGRAACCWCACPR